MELGSNKERLLWSNKNTFFLQPTHKATRSNTERKDKELYFRQKTLKLFFNALDVH